MVWVVVERIVSLRIRFLIEGIFCSLNNVFHAEIKVSGRVWMPGLKPLNNSVSDRAGESIEEPPSVGNRGIAMVRL